MADHTRLERREAGHGAEVLGTIVIVVGNSRQTEIGANRVM